MSDRGYAILIATTKYVFINILATIVMKTLVRVGLFHSDEAIILFYMIINCTALLIGRIQRVSDKIKEIEMNQENPKNNA